MKDKLTEKQENFAFSVAYKGNNYSDAYRECYNVREGTKPECLWVTAHKIAHNPKVMLRIKELKKQRAEEAKASLSWTFKRAEDAALYVLEKNLKDMQRAETKGESAKDANNKGVLEALKILNDMTKECAEEEAGSTEKGLRVTIVNDLPEQDE